MVPLDQNSIAVLKLLIAMVFILSYIFFRKYEEFWSGLYRRKFPTKTHLCICSLLQQRRAMEPILLVIIMRVARAKSSLVASLALSSMFIWPKLLATMSPDRPNLL